MILAIDVLHNSLAVMMALRVLRVRIRPLFVCFAALTGALIACAVRLIHLSRGAQALFWLPCALLMMRIAAGGGGGLSGLLRRGAALLACEGFLGGVVLALYGATGSLPAAHLMSGACCAAVFVGARRAAQDAALAQRVRVICRIAQNSLEFDAIVDSGNTLRDYLTGRPVIVAGMQVFDALENADVPVRLIFAETAGGRQMMRLLIPQETTLVISGRRLSVRAALAFSPALGKEALTPASLLV